MIRTTARRAERTGLDFLRNRFYNKGTAFSLEERARLGMAGRLPPAVETIEEQLQRCHAQLSRLDSPINRYQFLRSLQDNNNVLYYAYLLENLEEVLPVIYTPTVGEACQKFGSLYMRDHGIYISRRDMGSVKDILANSRRAGIDVMVITDGSRILGLGDLGTNGMGISIGKCSLYVAGAGLDPRRVLPVMLDVGTNNDAFREDEMYLGLREPRCSDETFYGLLDEFMAAARDVYPEATVQFEDFSNNHCFGMLERYRNDYRCFNDDIQGTGAVVAAGFVNAVRLSGLPPQDQRVVVYGAGSAAVGVVESIADLLALEYGMKRDDVIKSVYLVDTRGLVTTTRGDKLAAHKVPLARTDIAAEDNAQYSNLWDTVQKVRPTALIGLAGAGPAFTKPMVEFVASYTARPIVFPLSNPTSKAEITAANAYEWTNGAAIVASGSPFPATTIGDRVFKASQGNNMYIFPGVGLGAKMAAARSISDATMTKAAAALANMVPPEQLKNGLYPPLTDIRRVSAVVAAAVARQCEAEGVVGTGVELPPSQHDLIRNARVAMWTPQYLEPSVYYDYLSKTEKEQLRTVRKALAQPKASVPKPKAAPKAAPKVAPKSRKVAGAAKKRST